MDRFLRKQGIDIDRLSVLDRLAFLGRHTMGALIYEPAAKHEKTDKTLDLEALAQHSRQIMEGEAVDILPALMKAGGSPGGEHSMSISGEGGAPGKKEVFRLGEKTGLSFSKIGHCLFSFPGFFIHPALIPFPDRNDEAHPMSFLRLIFFHVGAHSR